MKIPKVGEKDVNNVNAMKSLDTTFHQSEVQIVSHFKPMTWYETSETNIISPTGK